MNDETKAKLAANLVKARAAKAKKGRTRKVGRPDAISHLTTILETQKRQEKALSQARILAARIQSILE